MTNNGLTTLEMQNNIINKTTEQLRWADIDEQIPIIAAAEVHKQIDRIYEYTCGSRLALVLISNTIEIDQKINELKKKEKKGILSLEEKADLTSLSKKKFVDLSIRRNSAKAIPRASSFQKKRLDSWSKLLMNRMNSATKNKKIIAYILQKIENIFQTALNEHDTATRLLHDSWIVATQTLNTPAHAKVTSFMSASLQGQIYEALANTKKGSKEEKNLTKKLDDINQAVEDLL